MFFIAVDGTIFYIRLMTVMNFVRHRSFSKTIIFQIIRNIKLVF